MKKFCAILIGVSLSGIHAQQWIEQIQPSPQMPLWSVSAVNGSVVWACGEQGTILYTSNSGFNWIRRAGGQIGNNGVYAITGIDSLNALCAVNSTAAGHIYRTTDAGMNWFPVYAISGGFINDIKRIDFSSFFAYGNPVGGRWLLLKSTDGGSTFDSLGLRLTQSGNEIGWPNALAVLGTNIWFGTNNFRIYRSINGGVNWNTGAVSAMNIYSVSFNNTNGFAVGDLAYFSGNSGANWNILNNLPGNGVFRAVTNLGVNFWYARETEIFYSSNGGVNFNFQYTSPSAGIFRHLSFAVSPNNNILTTIRGWGVTNNGAISYYAEASGIIKISNELPVSSYLHQNYPNPFNPATKIRFDIPANVKSEKSNVKMIVYDILGREVSVLVNEQLNPGRYEVNFDASNFTSGIYFYRLETEGFAETKKMLYQK